MLAIKESVEAKLHCRKSTGISSNQPCPCELRYQNKHCPLSLFTEHYNMPGLHVYDVTQCAYEVTQILPTLTYLILQRYEGTWSPSQRWKGVFTPGLESRLLQPENT